MFKSRHSDFENGGKEMFNPLNKIYRQFGIDTEDLIYYLLSFDDIRSRYDVNSDEYKYCMSELHEILLEDHEESFFDKCIDVFYRQTEVGRLTIASHHVTTILWI